MKAVVVYVRLGLVNLDLLSRGFGIARLVAQVLIQAIKKQQLNGKGYSLLFNRFLVQKFAWLD